MSGVKRDSTNKGKIGTRSKTGRVQLYKATKQRPESLNRSGRSGLDPDPCSTPSNSQPSLQSSMIIRHGSVQGSLHFYISIINHGLEKSHVEDFQEDLDGKTHINRTTN